MAKLELWKTLQDLKDEEFVKFKWILEQDNIVKGFPGIPVAKLEKAEREGTVDLMVQKYHHDGALEITLKILENISRNDLVHSLQKSSSEPKDLKSFVPVPVRSDYGRKKAELGETKAEIERLIQERQMKILEIQRSEELSSECAHRHIADSQQVFTVLQQLVETTLTNIVAEIEEKRKTAKKQAEGFIRELEKEICDLTKRSTELEQVSSIENQLDFLKSFANLNGARPTKNWTEVSVTPPSYGISVGSSVNELEENIRREKEKLIAKAKLNRLRQFARDVTLDPDTASPHLILSDDGKQVYCGGVRRNLPDNPERFNTAINVLGKQSFSSGRFYYEVDVKQKTSWDLGVVKESINRKGSIILSPKNGYWTIGLKNGDKYIASACCLSVNCQPKKVGVFVDYEKGSVSFYDVDSADIIHCFTDCSFTEKLYPFFSPGLHHGGKNSTPLIISPVF